MSGAERQRLALARALLADPPMLVLDEPTAHLDPETAAGLIRDLLDATTGRTVLLITNDQALAAGRVPSLHELRLHNGTVWRWNRPVYDVQAGRPQLRIENRVLPSGPTAVDMAANAAFYFGLVRALADTGPPPWTAVPFRVAEQDLHRAARHGVAARLRWRGHTVRADRLVLDELLPAAASGLDAGGVASADRDRYLGVIASRTRCGQTGAAWQTGTVERLEQRHRLERTAALREMTRRYVEHARTGAPVHSWPMP